MDNLHFFAKISFGKYLMQNTSFVIHLKKLTINKIYTFSKKIPILCCYINKKH